MNQRNSFAMALTALFAGVILTVGFTAVGIAGKHLPDGKGSIYTEQISSGQEDVHFQEQGVDLSVYPWNHYNGKSIAPISEANKSFLKIQGINTLLFSLIGGNGEPTIDLIDQLEGPTEDGYYFLKDAKLYVPQKQTNYAVNCAIRVEKEVTEVVYLHTNPLNEKLPTKEQLAKAQSELGSMINEITMGRKEYSQLPPISYDEAPTPPENKAPFNCEVMNKIELVCYLNQLIYENGLYEKFPQINPLSEWLYYLMRGGSMEILSTKKELLFSWRLSTASFHYSYLLFYNPVSLTFNGFSLQRERV